MTMVMPQAPSRWRRASCRSARRLSAAPAPGAARCHRRHRSFGSQHVHDVRNISAGPAISIHAYSPPLSAMRRYDLIGSGLVQTAIQSAERGW